MPATNKQHILSQLFAILPERMEVREGATRTETPPVLEQFVYASCREGTTKTLADVALTRLQEQFFDWNEIRVSSTREIAEVLDDLPSPDARAQKIVSFLQEVFELHFSFDMENLHKKGIKVAAKQMARYDAANDYIISSVVQRSLGGHAIPLDEPTLRTVRRLGLVEGTPNDIEQIRSSLEHQVPKAKGVLFADLVSDLAARHCTNEPQCSGCPLNESCPQIMDADSETLELKLDATVTAS